MRTGRGSGRRAQASVLLGVLTFSGILFSGCTPAEDPFSNVLRVALHEDAKTLDPANAYDQISLEILPSIEETLLQYRYLEDTLVLEPLLAESLPEFSKDGKTVTIRIKKGLQFQDDPCFKANGGKGRELKATDFIFQFKRLALPAIHSQGAWIFEDKVVGFREFETKLKSAKSAELKSVFEEPVEGFAALDDYTIRIRLLKPDPILSAVLAMNFTSPVPRESVEVYADQDGNLRDHPVGTGPFVLRSWEVGQRVVLEKNPNHHETYPVSASEGLKAQGFLKDAGKPIPFLDGISFEIIKEESSRMTKFEKGEVDTLELGKEAYRSWMVEGARLREDLERKGVRLGVENSLVTRYVSFNVKDKLLQNKALRQAISSAIDRETWIREFDPYRGAPQDQVSPPGLVDRLEKSSLKYGYNLARARELLAKAGYPEGKGLPVIHFDFRGNDSTFRKMGEMFVQQLGAIGIRINPILNSFPGYLEKTRLGETQISFGGWIYDYPDVENGYQLLYGPNRSPGPNDSNWENPRFDMIYRRIADLPAGAPGRRALVKEAEDLIQEEVPWAFGYYQKACRLAQARVQYFRVAEGIQNKYKYLRLGESSRGQSR